MLATGALLALLARPAFAGQSSDVNMPLVSDGRGPPTRVVLVGASIGQDWNLADLPRRSRASGLQFEAVQAWQFDKSEALQDALMRPARRFRPTLSYFKGILSPPPAPFDVFILKECSSYFPSAMQRNRELVKEWAHSVVNAKKRLVLATVVPITESRARRDPGKQEGLVEFNDWLRQYARQEGYPLVDLEAALRIDGSKRFLRNEFTSGDGSHLNRAAYDVLDGVLLKTICGLARDGACTPSGPSQSK